MRQNSQIAFITVTLTYSMFGDISIPTLLQVKVSGLYTGVLIHPT